MSFDRVHSYDVVLAWEGDRHGALTAGDRPAILGGPPPDFDGRDTWWSPEHMLLGSLSLCLMTTYLALAARENLRLGAYRTKAHATVEKTPAGFSLVEIRLEVHLKAEAGEVARATSLMDKAKRYCIVSNALKPAIELRLDVTAA